MTPGQEALLEAARLEQARVIATPCREFRQADHVLEVERIDDSYYGPASPAVIRAVVEELTPVRVVRDLAADQRREIEQGIARGDSPLHIAERTGASLADVQAVIDHLDALSA